LMLVIKKLIITNSYKIDFERDASKTREKRAKVLSPPA